MGWRACARGCAPRGRPGDASANLLKGKSRRVKAEIASPALRRPRKMPRRRAPRATQPVEETFALEFPVRLGVGTLLNLRMDNMTKLAKMFATLVPVFAIAAATLPAQAQNLDRRIRVINNTSYTMLTFQASNVARRTWEEDILGRNRVLRSGQSIVVNLNDGSGYCVFDLRARFQGGREATRRRVNICQVSSWTIND